MSRLIDADALIKKAHHEAKGMEKSHEDFGVLVEWLVDKTPTIEPERKKGKWIMHQDGSGTCDQCRIRQIAIWDFDGWQNFCGHCGADMQT